MTRKDFLNLLDNAMRDIDRAYERADANDIEGAYPYVLFANDALTKLKRDYNQTREEKGAA